MRGSKEVISELGNKARGVGDYSRKTEQQVQRYRDRKELGIVKKHVD